MTLLTAQRCGETLAYTPELRNFPQKVMGAFKWAQPYSAASAADSGAFSRRLTNSSAAVG